MGARLCLHTTLQITDGARAKIGPFGQLFLGQPGCLPVTVEQDREASSLRRFH
jgi:hypothetical protein